MGLGVAGNLAWWFWLRASYEVVVKLLVRAAASEDLFESLLSVF